MRGNTPDFRSDSPPPYSTPLRAPFTSQDAPSSLPQIRKNVIIFGESGAGKSSVINMLLGDVQALTSNSATGCTFKSDPFPLDFPPDFGPAKPLKLWDTAGLNEGDVGTVPSTDAIVSLYQLLNQLSNSSGVSLLVFVIRGPRIKASTQHNWTLFKEVICQNGVPSIVVVTGMENLASKPNGMDDWWEENVETFRNYAISPTRYACVTASKGRKTKKGIFTNEDLYLESRQRLLERIYSACAVQPLQVPPIQWFKTVLEKSFLGIKFRHTQEKEVLVDDILETLRDKCGMKEGDAFALGKRLQKLEIYDSKHVVVFGESGVGKSSVINMLLGATETSPRGCTFEPTSFLLDFRPNKPLTLWDTVGFNVGNVGVVPETEAIVALYKLLHKLSNAGGVSLLVLVIRGPHIKETTQHNWTLFNDVICKKGIPSIVVVTGMEDMANKPNGMDDWREENKETFTKYGISPTRYACVTTSKGRKTNKGIFADEGLYLESQQRLLSIIHSAHAVLPLQVPPIQWFKTVLEKSFLGIKYRHTREKDVLVDNILETLRDKCGMAEDEAIMLEKRLKEVEIDPGF